jgi:twitching motility two-component system response regulator PilG
MQGNLAEIGIANIFKLLESEQQTGILQVKASNNRALKSSESNSQAEFSWSFLLDRGQISYAFKDEDSNFSCLQDYLSYDQLEDLVTIDRPFSVNTSNYLEYDYLNYLLQRQLISTLRAKTILSNIIGENLWEVLSLSRGEFVFKSGCFFANSIYEKKLTPAIEKITSQLRIWQQFYPYITSSDQQIRLLDRDGLAKIASAKTYGNLTAWSESQLSLIRLSRKINCQLVDLGSALYPYLKKGLIKLQNLASSNSIELSTAKTLKLPHIVWIHDNVAINKKVEYILKHRDYKLTIFVNPIEALRGILTIQPDLILCKADLPELSGYELCSMLKKTQAARQIKFVMSIEEDSFSNRLQARIADSEDYLVSPFTQNELLITIDKYSCGKRTQNLARDEFQLGAKANA